MTGASLVNPDVIDVGSPPIPEARAWAEAYDGSHGPIADLTQAVPGYPPHPELLARLAEAAHSGAPNAYGPITGDIALRDAYAAHVSGFYEARIGAGDVAMTAGCNMAFTAATMLIARRGEAVLVPAPWYFNHQMTPALLGIEARPLPCRPEAGFVPEPEEAERLLDERVRAIVLVTPNNPTGAVYPAPVIEAFAALCRRHGLWLILDETYRDFLPAGANHSHRVFSEEGWRGTVIGLYSFSKSYCIPGYRSGAMIVGSDLVPDLTKILDCLQICAPRIAQAALSWGIDALGDWRERNRAEMNARSAAFRQAIGGLPGWRIESSGAYFAYLRHPFEGVPAFEVSRALASTAA